MYDSLVTEGNIEIYRQMKTGFSLIIYYTMA